MLIQQCCIVAIDVCRAFGTKVLKAIHVLGVPEPGRNWAIAPGVLDQLWPHPTGELEPEMQ